MLLLCYLLYIVVMSMARPISANAEVSTVSPSPDSASLTVNIEGNLEARIADLVYNTVSQAVAERYKDADFTVSTNKLPNISRLQACASVTAELRSKNLYGRVPVYIRCEHPAPWSLYASATVHIEIPVVVTQRAIARGERISKNMLGYENRPLHRLRPHTVVQIADAVGKTSRRPMAAKTTLNLSTLTTPPVVNKGERVKIKATSGRVTIHSFGVALADGQVGDQIQVRNENSERVIRPWILGPGKVGTRPPDLAGAP
jgi:flagellar basal body P-ring formation protein FlgA